MIWLVATLFWLGMGSPSWALPLFALQYGDEIHGDHIHDELLMTKDCRACHVNPTGGGMRNDHGREFATNQLSITEPSAEAKSAAEAAQLSDSLSVGADLRFAYIKQEVPGATNTDVFFPMQADFYAAFSPTEHLTLYYQDGVESASRETFLLFQRLPFNSHVKIGRFIPPYGLKVDDHTTYIREKLGFGAPGFGQDAGFEAGLGGHHLFANAAIFNGEGPNSEASHAKGISGTGGLKLSQAWLAGSYLNNETPATETTYSGGYAGVRLWRLTLMGELDRFTIKDLASDVENTGTVSYAELAARVAGGVTASIRHEQCKDDDGSVCIDDTEIQRITYGLTVYPLSFTEVILQYRQNTEDQEVANDEIIAMLHFYY
jgi:hypothetical protein